MATRRYKTYEERHELETITPDHRLPLKVMTFSQVAMYQRCPKQYFFRYVEGRKSPPSVPLVEGSSHHAWLDVNNRKKIQTGKYMKAKESVEMFVDDFERRSEEVDNWEGDSFDRVVKRANTMIVHYLDKVAPAIVPTGSEEKFEAVWDGTPVMGFSDLVEADTIWDYKVTGKPKTDRDVVGSLQLMAYAKAFKKKKVGFVSFNKKTANVTLTKAYAPKQQEKDWAVTVVAEVARAVRADAFPPTSPENWWCSSKFCGFWDICRGAKKRVGKRID